MPSWEFSMGIDTGIWDPSTDPLLESNFSATQLGGRDQNRRALRSRLGFPEDLIPLATVVTRLTEQKGIDLLLPIIPLLAQVPMRMAVLGSGDAALSAQLHESAARYPDFFAFVEGYDEALIPPDVRWC
jgi:starch synthase